jgi:hypothetical protein
MKPGDLDIPVPKRTRRRTCGPQCWNAKGDTCHCVCGGKNHGSLAASDPREGEGEIEGEENADL